MTGEVLWQGSIRTAVDSKTGPLPNCTLPLAVVAVLASHGVVNLGIVGRSSIPGRRSK